jgi:3-isopropylmalate dehydrogenase
MFLSGAMMLDWLGDRESVAEGRSAANLIRRAVESALRVVQPIEVGGGAGTAAITKTVLDAVVSLPLEAPA